MKPHKHAELIHAWANGAKVQYRYSTDAAWRDTCEPVWCNDMEYRIKPEREFEDGAWYPVIINLEKQVLAYDKRVNGFCACCDVRDFTWIGEKLDIRFPE